MGRNVVGLTSRKLYPRGPKCAIRRFDLFGEIIMGGMSRLIAVGVLALAAPVAAQAQSAGINPGQWEIAVTINSMDMPGAPPAIANMMKGKTTKVKHCITPEEAARGPQELLKSDKSCTFTRYSMTGGALSSEMVCKQGGGMMTATTTGSFTPDSFTATGRTVSTGGMPMTMTSTSVGQRVGDCKR